MEIDLGDKKLTEFKSKMQVINFFFNDFVTWAIIKVFFEFVKTLLLFHVLVLGPQGMCNLSSPTRNQMGAP